MGGRRAVSLSGEVDEIVAARGLPELTASTATTVEVRYANSTADYGTEGEIGGEKFWAVDDRSHVACPRVVLLRHLSLHHKHTGLGGRP